MNADARAIPIKIMNEAAITSPSQKALILRAIHKGLKSKVEDREKYQEMRVEVGFNKKGWPDRLTVYTTHKGIYLFETDELRLNSKGQLIGTGGD
jgi:hypothetical protein